MSQNWPLTLLTLLTLTLLTRGSSESRPGSSTHGRSNIIINIIILAIISVAILDQDILVQASSDEAVPLVPLIEEKPEGLVCRFGWKCKRGGCFYMQPAGRELDEDPTKGMCNNGEACASPDCIFKHPPTPLRPTKRKQQFTIGPRPRRRTVDNVMNWATASEDSKSVKEGKLLA